ncbi:hypothetical protein E7T09_12995 [Deinococcus sp. KSM4-11]|uniref:hypothetical protein n=1 Tax=Deinococcus sp. KSM4-11 TaxID=2568654 RepID=UPI0010A559B7|nr:hypothetical protein [Deinococcus sp. KSM4-11]THF86141.1 hypothetical protein E7T09_12995 [Deinococcus sp. KSM4-11]
MTPRGKVGRVEVLEAEHAARIEAANADTGAKIGAGLARLSEADRAAYRDAVAVSDGDPDLWDSLLARCAHIEDAAHVEHPAKEEAEAWAALAFEDRDGVWIPRPARPADFAAYFEACAAWCDALAVCVPVSPEVHRVARWGVALWRLHAAVCRVAGGMA